MDTLSRKHRLRQQQQERPTRVVVPASTNQQVLYANCEKNHLHRFPCKNNNNSTNNNNNNGDNSDDHDDEDHEEQFKVFQVVELGKSVKHQQLPAVQVERAGERLNGSRSQKSLRNGGQEAPTVEQIARREKNDELFSIVYMHPPNSYSSLTKRNHSLASSNNADSGSTRSTAGYSSGFQSETGSGPGTNKSSQLSKRQSGSRLDRSRLIDDLDRLMGEANRSRSGGGSPTESYLSAGAGVSGVMSHELDYSTLCRDEFSSFITAGQLPVDGPSTQPAPLPAGPVLVGVHHEARPTLEPAATPTSSGGTPDSCTSSGSSCLSRTASGSPVSLAGEEEEEDERWMLHERQERAIDSYGELASCGRQDNLSHLLELHLNRVESLLRLARGDQSVTLDEAFGSGGLDNQIPVSEEHKTLIEYTPLKQQPSASTRVLQEVCSVSLGSEEDTEEELDKSRVYVERHLCERHFRSLLGSAQTSARLNWDQQLADLDQVDSLVRGQYVEQQVDSRGRRRLEESLLRGLLNEGEPDMLYRSADYLVSTVKRHMSEFIDNYNAYQRQLMTETSFGADWHQNWLFAYKRPIQDTCEQQDQVSKKRAKMTPPPDDEATQDLIKYSTLVLSRCKPIKLTYPPYPTTTELAQCSTGGPLVSELESCYLAQEERSKELETRALEFRHETDVCRLLLSDIFADNLSEHDLTLKKPRRRPLQVRYDCSNSVAPGGAGFSFSAHGYLFELSSLRRMAASPDRRRRLTRLRSEILRRFRELITLDPPRGLLESAEPCEQVRFVIKLSNVELINRLPVVQFCAKVEGGLPMSIRWFREDGEELSDVSSAHQRRNLRYRMDSTPTGSWPIEMEANYDYEYRNQWSSWYRFRRRQGDVLFEIREADLEMDYGQRFRCVVQNHCSQSESTFSLTRRQEEVKSERKSAKRQKDGRALLRTWSQRTLHKPQPQTDVRSSEQVPEEKSVGAEDDSSRRLERWQQTVGRRSTLLMEPDDEVKFGRDFPYHPENLLKRLEENKFCVTLKCKSVKTSIIQQVEPTSGIVGEESSEGNKTEKLAETEEPSRQFTEPGERCEGLSPPLRAERQSSTRQQLQPKAETTSEQQQVRVEVQPKPRSRLRVGQTAAAESSQQVQQVQSRSTGSHKGDHQRQVCAPQQVQDAGHSRSQPRATGKELQQNQPAVVSQRLKDDIGQSKKAAISTAIKPEVMAKPASLEAADWIPKANVKSLISRFSKVEPTF